MCSIAWWHFQWPWRTPNPVFKVTAFLKSNISKNLTRLRDKVSIYNTIKKSYTVSMTPVLRSLYWLPVRQRVTFKTAVIMFKCLHGQAPLAVPDRVVQTDIIRRWASSSSFCIHSSADRSTYENKLQRPQLLCSRSLCVEQSAERLAVIGHVVRNI